MRAKGEFEVVKFVEHEGKELLKRYGIPVPDGGLASTVEEGVEVAGRLGYPVVLKAQIKRTGRKEAGGVVFAETEEELKEKFSTLLSLDVKGERVRRIRIEKKLPVAKEYFVGFVVSDETKSPVLVVSTEGGTGIEEVARTTPERVKKLAVNGFFGLRKFEAFYAWSSLSVGGKRLKALSELTVRAYKAFAEGDCRSLEINPLAELEDGTFVALDSHVVVDDYGLFRHPEYGVEFAREIGREPTELELIAYKIEEADYRGTFYFIEMESGGEGDLVGFHGAGGGGSMMSMDALLNEGFTLANFCDTSGNPPGSKFYRAAKVILSIPGIKGYFASGSGVASQEQTNQARGIAKAFLEDGMDVPAVLRLGGNKEEEAVELISRYLSGLEVPVVGRTKSSSPKECARELRNFVEECGGRIHEVPRFDPEVAKDGKSLAFKTFSGEIWLEHALCEKCDAPCVERCPHGLLGFSDGRVVLTVSEEEFAKGRCTECLACEFACKFEGRGGMFFYLPIPGLYEYRRKLRGE